MKKRIYGGYELISFSGIICHLKMDGWFFCFYFLSCAHVKMQLCCNEKAMIHEFSSFFVVVCRKYYFISDTDFISTSNFILCVCSVKSRIFDLSFTQCSWKKSAFWWISMELRRMPKLIACSSSCISPALLSFQCKFVQLTDAHSSPIKYINASYLKKEKKRKQKKK